MKSTLAAAVLAAGLISTGSAFAAAVTLDFEGLGNNASVGNFYGSAGATFGADALVFTNIGSESPTFSNAPSPLGIMASVGPDATMNVASGFNGVASLFYSSATNTAVNIWSGLNGTGSILGTLNLTNNIGSCDPGGAPYCNWTLASFNLGANVAHSMTFGDVDVNFQGIDNVAINTVPIPAALPLLSFGLAGMGAMLRRRKKAAV